VITRVRLAFFVLLTATLSCGGEKAYQPQNGDLVFQTSRSAQSLAIQRVAHSPYSHMGVVYVDHGSPYVYEAIGPVTSTPLREWIRDGVGAHFVAKRLRNAREILTADNLAKLMREGEELRGRPYDPYFEWSDDRIYCSELVWKMYERALGIEIGQTQELGTFDFSDSTVSAEAHKRWGSSFPRGETVISPAAMFQSDRLVTVYSQ